MEPKREEVFLDPAIVAQAIGARELEILALRQQVHILSMRLAELSNEEKK